jgi:hypothetical protein
MTKRLNTTGKAAIGAAIGSAAVAAAVLYVNRRKDKKPKEPQSATGIGGEPPETD